MRRRHFLTGLAATGLALTTGSASARAEQIGTAPAGGGSAEGWTVTPVPEVEADAGLWAVAAESPDLAWALGEQGASSGTPGRPLALRWDGSAWSETDTSGLSPTGRFRSVGAGGAGNTWALADGPDETVQLLAWDGTGWEPTPFPDGSEPGTRLNAVRAESDGSAVAVGARGGDEPALLHWDGAGWHWSEPLPADTVPSLQGLTRAPDGTIWAYGHEHVVRWDGAWSVVPYPPGLRSGITGLQVVAPDDVWLTGFDFGIGGPVGKPSSVMLRHFDGTEWTHATRPFTVGRLTDIAAEPGAPDAPWLIAGWNFWEQNSAHYLRWDASLQEWVGERGTDAGAPVEQSFLAPIPGSGGCWSVGRSEGRPRIERRA